MLAFLAAAALAISPAAAILDPDWEHLPSAYDLEQAYPPSALKRGVEGRAVIDCKVNVFGDLDGCVVAAEQPAGEGFGGAALRLSSGFHMRPRLNNGVAEEATVRIPIRFKVGQSPVPPKIPIRRWAPFVAAVPVIGLLLAALADLGERGLRPPLSLWRMLLEANIFVFRAWRHLPAPLLMVVSAAAGAALAPAAPTPASPFILGACAVLGAVGLLMTTAAACRLQFHPLTPDTPRLRPGPFGLRFGSVEGRLIKTGLLAFIVLVVAAALAALVTALAYAAVAVAAKWAGHGIWLLQFQNGVLGVMGLGAMLTAVCLMLLLLIWSRMIVLVPAAVFDDAVHVSDVWRLTRGAWLASMIATALLVALETAGPVAIFLIRPLVSPSLGFDGPLAATVALAAPAVLLAAWLAPFQIGLTLSFFGALGGAETDG